MWMMIRWMVHHVTYSTNNNVIITYLLCKSSRKGNKKHIINTPRIFPFWHRRHRRRHRLRCVAYCLAVRKAHWPVLFSFLWSNLWYSRIEFPRSIASNFLSVHRCGSSLFSFLFFYRRYLPFCSIVTKEILQVHFVCVHKLAIILVKNKTFHSKPFAISSDIYFCINNSSSLIHKVICILSFSQYGRTIANYYYKSFGNWTETKRRLWSHSISRSQFH